MFTFLKCSVTGRPHNFEFSFFPCPPRLSNFNVLYRNLSCMSLSVGAWRQMDAAMTPCPARLLDASFHPPKPGTIRHPPAACPTQLTNQLALPSSHQPAASHQRSLPRPALPTGPSPAANPQVMPRHGKQAWHPKAPTSRSAEQPTCPAQLTPPPAASRQRSLPDHLAPLAACQQAVPPRQKTRPQRNSQRNGF